MVKTLTLGDDDIVVLVGPNNAGKSAALRELEHYAGRTEQQKVITNVKLKQEGTAGTLRLWLEDNAMRVGAAGSHSFSGMNFQIHHSHINFFAINQPNLH